MNTVYFTNIRTQLQRHQIKYVLLGQKISKQHHDTVVFVEPDLQAINQLNTVGMIISM